MALQLESRMIQTTVRDKFLVRTKREKIIQAASKVFIEKGFHKATIRDISEASGLSVGVIYNYVKKKEDILYLIFDKLSTLLTETLVAEMMNDNDDPSEQLKRILRKVIDITWHHQDLLLLMYQETAALDKQCMYSVLSRESDSVTLMEKVLKRGKKKGVIRNKDTGIAADIIIFLLALIPLRRWNLKRRFNEEQIKAGIMDFILKALCIDQSRL